MLKIIKLATTEIHLKRNDNFVNWSGVAPYFEDVYFDFYPNKEPALVALEVGIIDMVDAQFYPQPNELPANVGYEFVDEPCAHEIAINMNHPILGTGEDCPISGFQSALYVRKALSHIIPREQYCEEVYNGFTKPGVTGCSPCASVFDTSLEPYEYNITLAKNYMTLAGYEFPVYHGSTVSVATTLPTFICIIGLLGSCMYTINKVKRNRNKLL